MSNICNKKNEKTIKIGIVGYGHLGKGIEKCLAHFPDMQLIAIFTRRDPESLSSQSRVEPFDRINEFKRDIDVLILAGSSQDIPALAPSLIADFNTVDCFDNHDKIAVYFKKMDDIAQAHNKVAIVSTGWDPGLFSIQRMLMEAMLPNANTYTFWGPGLSQGHSDIVRRVDGVKYGVQYTIPSDEMMEQIRAGQKVDYTLATAHRREVYIVLEEKADAIKITKEIQEFPVYFAPYQTSVHIISEAEFFANHQGMPHGGRVLRQGETTDNNKATYEFSLKFDHNPEITASISLAFARAAHRLYTEEIFGAKTVLDIPLRYLSLRDHDDMLEHLI